MNKLKAGLCIFLFSPFLLNANNNKKNILFIVVDDLRPMLGCYGEKSIVSPNIDYLSSKSFTFHNAYCQQAVSGASRASFLTGLTPDETGVTDLKSHFRKKQPDIKTLPQFFKENYYFTTGIGKIFHASRNTQDSLSWSIPPKYNITKKEDEYQQKKNKHGGKAASVEVTDCANSLYIDSKITQEAISEMKHASKLGKPFFLAVGYYKPHLPFVVPKKYWDLYKHTDLNKFSSLNNPIKGAPTLAYHNCEELRGYSDIPKIGAITNDKKEVLLKGYFACVSYIDDLIGQLLSTLEDLQLTDKTIIVLCSDHGYHLGEQDLWCKSTNYESACKVPLIIYDPQLKNQPKKIYEFVELIDVYPTLAELCDFNVPQKLSGKSLIPLFRGEKANNWKNRAFSQFPRPYNSIFSTKNQTHMGYTIRVKDWRYTLWYDVKTNEITDRELYKLSENNIETNNLSGESKYSHIEHKLTLLIEEYKHQTNIQ